MKAADLFDDWARRGRAEGMEEGHGQTAGPLIASLPMGAGKRFLDLGCGNGWAARFAASQGCHSDGIDASAEMVKRATDAAGELHAKFQQGDFADLPFEDDRFHLVWSMEAVYYAPDPDQVLKEVLRVLGPDGEFHMLIDFYGENEESHSWPTDVGVPMVLRSEAEWVAAFEAAGFDEVEASRLRSTDPEADAWKHEHGSLYISATKPEA